MQLLFIILKNIQLKLLFINKMQDSEKTQQDIKFEQILTIQNGYSIRQFYSQTPENLFENATSHPAFFDENLVSPNRVLKQLLNNVHANIKIFYYQLLRVSYEIETVNGFNRSYLRNLIRIVFNPEFQILFTPDTEAQRQLFNDFQFKKFFAQFINLLQNQQSPNIQQIVNCFPIIDAVFIHLFRSLLALQGLHLGFEQKIPTQDLFATLSHSLGLNITSFGKCWKFSDSDMFCYQENQNQLYLAYILGGEQEESINQNQINNVQNINNNQQIVNNQKGSIELTHQERFPQAVNPSYIPEVRKQQPRESMISETYQFVDFTNTTTLYKQKKPKTKTQQPITHFQKQQNNVENPKLYQKYQNSYQNVYESKEQKIPLSTQYYNSNDSQSISNTLVKNEYVNNNNYINNSYNFENTEIPKNSYNIQPLNETKYSFQQKEQTPVYSSNLNYNFETDNSYKIESTYQPNQYQKSTKFYQEITEIKPKQINIPSVYKYEKPIQNKNQLIYNTDSKIKSNMTSINTNQLGDYYKDFTNSFILQKINQPHKSNIKGMRNRMKGMKRGAIAPQNFTTTEKVEKINKPTNSYNQYNNGNDYLFIQQKNYTGQNYESGNYGSDQYSYKNYYNYEPMKTNFY